MTDKKEDHGRSKYRRTIYDIDESKTVTVDVYSVLVAFDVQCPARQHAVKKMLCAGLRGKGDAVQDLKEAIVALERAIQLAENRSGTESILEYDKSGARCVQEITDTPGSLVSPYGSLGWQVYLVYDDEHKTNPVGYRVGWPCGDGRAFLVRHYMAAEKGSSGPSLNWCKNAAERQAERWNRAHKRPEEFAGYRS